MNSSRQDEHQLSISGEARGDERPPEARGEVKKWPRQPPAAFLKDVTNSPDRRVALPPKTWSSQWELLKNEGGSTWTKLLVNEEALSMRRGVEAPWWSGAAQERSEATMTVEHKDSPFVDELCVYGGGRGVCNGKFFRPPFSKLDDNVKSEVHDGSTDDGDVDHVNISWRTPRKRFALKSLRLADGPWSVLTFDEVARDPPKGTAIDRQLLRRLGGDWGLGVRVHGGGLALASAAVLSLALPLRLAAWAHGSLRRSPGGHRPEFIRSKQPWVKFNGKWSDRSEHSGASAAALEVEAAI
ncbi:hypothetical protein AK812_SmicGene44566 [Symbiodinium microadriaticum]|uniref:Uncharacterized protein n=1 Tax=Symbiodinium microadriaticum TaxID=2951 RepID=A0A1Q9BYF6_SYMMI|nr:hypothetical protein AK812_SmicGene44566 [Symbiodinium microadriaticum]